GTPAGHARSAGVEIRLQNILDTLPLELQPRLLRKKAGETVIHVALEKVLSQLSRGAVKISFGELRHMAPGFFSPDADRDKTLVLLPLGEVLGRLNPALITRRRVQKHLEIPAEITSPFDPASRGLAAQAPADAPAETQAPAEDHFTLGPARNGISEAAPISAPEPISFQNAPKLPPTRPIVPFDPSPASAPTPKAPSPAPAPVAQVPPASIPMPGIPAKPAPAAKPAAPAPISSAAPTGAPAPAPAAESAAAAPLVVNLAALAEGWPDAVRAEIVHLKLVETKVHLPLAAIEQALKQGKISFTWKSLRGMIKGSGVPIDSPQDGAVLELPLKVIAPLFLARQREAGKEKRKVAIAAEIPNLFFGSPQADVPGAAPKPADTNYYVWDDSSDTAHITLDSVKKKSTGTSFISRYATPNEVVSRAAALDGVAGALIALPDGLMVASRVAPDLNGETLAAFLPQIFSKVTPCTRELRMGELNNLSFTVGNVPWKIFRVNAIFFAVFGRAGEPMPTAQLAALAGELDHKAK
ncbi:MAG TPA: roadblock/LC7 domain-containing protein, partial [Verrucomicrobiae bacterium]|nr:roadblock/LC7 domain-containing protein [Verrucomicrobiae bacterium]